MACTFAVLDTMNGSLFTHYRGKQPFLLRGGARHWQAQGDWGLDAFTQARYGQRLLTVGCDDPSGVSSVESWSSHRLQLDEAIAAIRTARQPAATSGGAPDASAGEPRPCASPYIFDRGVFKTSPDLAGLVTRPSTHPAWFWSDRPAGAFAAMDAIMMIGAGGYRCVWPRASTCCCGASVFRFRCFGSGVSVPVQLLRRPRFGRRHRPCAHPLLRRRPHPH
jgi:hypothetical protein